MTWLQTTFTLAFSLFLLMDAVGNVPLFTSLLKDYHPNKQRKIILREMCIALFVILFFYWLGDYLLTLIGVSTYTVRISGGIILFLIALKMIFPSSHADHAEWGHKKEPFIVPLAIPLVAGPAVLAAVILYSHEQDISAVLSAIVIAWIPSTLLLLCSSFLKNLLGPRGLTACERLMGLLLTLLAVQMCLEGFRIYSNA